MGGAVSTHTKVETAAPAPLAARPGIRSAVERLLAMAHAPARGLAIERSSPYKELEREVLGLVEFTTPPSKPRRDVRVLDLGCGTGSFTVALAEAGFSAVGIDRYTALLDVARETRRARGLANASFSRVEPQSFADGEFDQIVSIHALYVHPAPEIALAEARRVLKPGGHAVFVNHTERFAAVWRTFRAAVTATGWVNAVATLRWLIPNLAVELVRRRVGPQYWDETQLLTRFTAAGFTVLQVRRTFLDGGSVLVWARKGPRP